MSFIAHNHIPSRLSDYTSLAILLPFLVYSPGRTTGHRYGSPIIQSLTFIQFIPDSLRNTNPQRSAVMRAPIANLVDC